jgi:Cu-Zn family superoxide dismutase
LWRKTFTICNEDPSASEKAEISFQGGFTMRTAVYVVTLAAVLVLAGAASAEQIVVQMNLISDQGAGASIGTVTLTDTPKGLKLAPSLDGLTPGKHGFHIHEKPECAAGLKDGKQAAGIAAGGHYDPANAGKHAGPVGKGHLGDLPVLTVGADGKATKAVVAPRLKTGDVKGRSLMIHAGGDNYGDVPEKLGGGGGRIACGVIK